MEDVLDLYAEEPHAQTARLCVDERPCILLDDVIAPLPATAGRPRRFDYEYQRHGTAVVLAAYCIETQQRYLEVRPRRTKQDYAQFLTQATQVLCGDKAVVHVVHDNLNTHTYGALYETFDAPTARAWARRFVFHYTPKHASWLNMVEIEFSALVRQCLDRRIGSSAQLVAEATAWMMARNAQGVGIHWSFTMERARITLHRHYHNVFSTD